MGGRWTRRYNTLRVEFRAICQATDEPCWLCGQPIDYLLGDSDDAFELDHYYPVSTHPEFNEDPANFKPSHRSCNRRRGNNAPKPGLGTTTRHWLRS